MPDVEQFEQRSKCRGIYTAFSRRTQILSRKTGRFMVSKNMKNDVTHGMWERHPFPTNGTTPPKTAPCCSQSSCFDVTLFCHRRRLTKSAVWGFIHGELDGTLWFNGNDQWCHLKITLELPQIPEISRPESENCSPGLKSFSSERHSNGRRWGQRLRHRWISSGRSMFLLGNFHFTGLF